MSNKDKASLMPKLRFPEFQSAKGWTSRELGDCLDYLQPTQYLVNSTAYSDNYEIPVVTAGKTFILGYTNETEGAFGQPLPVIIFDDFTTATQYVDFRFKAKSSAMKILLAKQNANIKFIYESMQQIDYEVGAHGRHWISAYSKIKVSVPEPEEQQKIADCLSSLDELIAAQARKVDALKTHKKGLMQQLFPREGETQPRLRFPEFRGAREWVEKKLSTIAELTSSKRVHLSDYVANGIPFFRGKEISLLKNNQVPEDILYISEEHYEEIRNKYGVPKIGDILITAVGTLGNVYCIQNLNKFYFKDGNLIWMKDISEDSVFLELLLNVGSKKVLSSAIGSSQKALTMVELNKLKFSFPKKEEQQRLADCLTSLDDLITAATQGLETLKTHKKGLMQQLFPSAEAVEA